MTATGGLPVARPVPARPLDVEVRVANNAVDTLFACGTSRPDLIILDLKIPGMRGEKL